MSYDNRELVLLEFTSGGNHFFSDDPDNTNYLNASTRTKTLAAGTSAVSMGADRSFVKGHAKFIEFWGQLKASAASGVYLRVFVAGSSSTASGLATKLFAIPNYETVSGKHFCGELGYTQIDTTIDASNTGTHYKVFAHPGNDNQGEYETPTFCKPGALDSHTGNYGVQYRLTLNNPNGKKIWIEPDWNVQGRTAATVVYRWFIDGSWVARSTPITKGGGYPTDRIWNCYRGSDSARR